MSATRKKSDKKSALGKTLDSLNHNPFSHVVGPKYAPHSPTLNSTLREKLGFSYSVIRDMLKPVLAIPEIVLSSINDILDKSFSLINQLPNWLYWLLFFPVTLPLILVGIPVILINLFFPTKLLNGVANIAAFPLAIAAAPITLGVHIVASLIYNSMFKVAQTLTGTKVANERVDTTLGAFLDSTKEDRSEFNMTTKLVKAWSDAANTYQIISQLRADDKNTTFTSVEFSSPSQKVEQGQQPNPAASNLIKLNYAGIADTLETIERDQQPKFSAQTFRHN